MEAQIPRIHLCSQKLGFPGILWSDKLTGIASQPQGSPLTQISHDDFGV
jgi:hypothetical protein